MALFTRAELEERNRMENAAIIIDNVVYDVSQFLQDHPGGPEVLLANAGRDASQCFQDIGHSDAALEWRDTFRIGEVVPEERREPVVRREGGRGTDAGTREEGWSARAVVDVCLPPALLAALAVTVYWYLLM